MPDNNDLSLSKILMIDPEDKKKKKEKKQRSAKVRAIFSDLRGESSPEAKALKKAEEKKDPSSDSLGQEENALNSMFSPEMIDSLSSYDDKDDLKKKKLQLAEILALKVGKRK